MEYLLQFVKQFGPQVGLICFFIWRDYSREKLMNSRLTKLEEYQKTKLEKLIVATHKIIQENTYYFKNITGMLATKVNKG